MEIKFNGMDCPHTYEDFVLSEQDFVVSDQGSKACQLCTVWSWPGIDAGRYLARNNDGNAEEF
jgi:hypothetical protein